jgi:hypothetical protein
VAIILIAAVVGTGLLLVRALTVFNFGGIAAAVFALAVFLIQGWQAMRGRLLLPFFTLMIVIGVPVLAIGRIVGPSIVLEILVVTALALGGLGLFLFGRSLARWLRPVTALTAGLLLFSALAVLGNHLNLGHVLQLHLDLQRMITQEQEDKRTIAAADEAVRERLGETGGPMAATMSEEEALDLGGLSVAESVAYRAKLRAAAEARRRLEQRKAVVDHGYGGIGEEFGPPPDPTKAEAADGAAADYGKMTQDAAYQGRLVTALRTWTPDEKARATTYAVTLSLWVKYVLLLTVLMAVLAYLQQLNRTDCAVFPLPVTGRWLDDFCRKEHVVWFDAEPAVCLPGFLRSAVLKGESFVLLGTDYAFADRRLARWDWGGRVMLAGMLAAGGGIGLWVAFAFEVGLFGILLIAILIVLLGRAALRRGIWQDHLRDDEPEFFAHSAFVFESAWFGRLSFSVKTPAVARRFLTDFRQAIDLRRISRATSPRTLMIVWAYPEDPPEDDFVNLAILARRENLRLVIVGRTRPSPVIDDRIEAIYEESDLI